MNMSDHLPHPTVLKRIAQTDNMQPQLYVQYTHHQWLKG